MTTNLGGATASVHPGGAPLGNQNARKHGLYSVRTAKELPVGPPDLNAEITTLRRYIASLDAASVYLTTPQEIAFTLRTLTVATLGLSRLVRTQIFAHPPDPQRDELGDEIVSVAEEVRQQMEPEGQVQCPNCHQATSLLSLSRIAADCHITGQPHLTFAFASPTSPNTRTNSPAASAKTSPTTSPSPDHIKPHRRPILDTEYLDDISRQHYLAHPKSLPSASQPSEAPDNFSSPPLSSSSLTSSSIPLCPLW